MNKSIKWLLLFSTSFQLLVFMVGGGGARALASSCVTSECHAGLGEFPTVHYPVQDQDCLSCHEQKLTEHPGQDGKKSFALIAQGSDLCYQCHDRMGTEKFGHLPVREGECLACHDPHGSSFPNLLAVGENQRELCLGCHDSGPFEQKYEHGPVALGACTYCHTPHGSSRKGLLREDAQQLCLGCHSDMAEGLKQAAVIHPAVTDLSCVSCHMPHGSAEPGLLKQKGESLCFECHENIQEKYRRAEYKHNALYEGKGCGNCHLVHYSRYSSLLADDEKTLCLSCHDHKDTSKSNGLRNIKQELADKKYLHGPIEDGSCTTCHDPHGGDYGNILNGAYPASFYAPFKKGVYGLCFGCHDEALATKRETEATGFRNGKQNLHFLHVADYRKGRTCMACHQPHASDGEKLINRDGAEFGAWKIPLRFEKSATGGSCMPGCHKKVVYDRKTPVHYELKGEK